MARLRLPTPRLKTGAGHEECKARNTRETHSRPMRMRPLPPPVATGRSSLISPPSRLISPPSRLISAASRLISAASRLHLGGISPRLPDRGKELGRQVGKVERRLRSREALQHQHGACETASRVSATPRLFASTARGAADTRPSERGRASTLSLGCLSAVSRLSLGDLSAISRRSLSDLSAISRRSLGGLRSEASSARPPARCATRCLQEPVREGSDGARLLPSPPPCGEARCRQCRCRAGAGAARL